MGADSVFKCGYATSSLWLCCWCYWWQVVHFTWYEFAVCIQCQTQFEQLFLMITFLNISTQNQVHIFNIIYFTQEEIVLMCLKIHGHSTYLKNNGVKWTLAQKFLKQDILQQEDLPHHMECILTSVMDSCGWPWVRMVLKGNLETPGYFQSTLPLQMLVR